ncbi:beta-ketoacyl synthase N-terminal-like domain-containing protein [Streptomyces sp. NBC_01565]|uniref:beta-ketoacyl synthase N-terminal-like domain-containing protein n=1 Tax=Streptomyces sp. NBC_01565 TaxID=2975881 RepID=UPI002251AA25|nr:beta-ketoacyl synthase N-terminal-like domain-containing protein [Streptomyces sp. NBC_01565]MCX4545916.1 ketosynthase chain-length factor [Streptomyces sp. NBC_01565]
MHGTLIAARTDPPPAIGVTRSAAGPRRPADREPARSGPGTRSRLRPAGRARGAHRPGSGRRRRLRRTPQSHAFAASRGERGATTSVVVTGLGVAAPNGLGAHGFWAATRTGTHAIGRITGFDPSPYPATLAGEVPCFTAEGRLPVRLLPQTDRLPRIALVATDWALADAGVDPQELGAVEMGVPTNCASVGLDPVAQARRRIREGADLIVSGAVDASLCPWGWGVQLASGRLSTSAEPTRAYLPFDAEAAGHVPGEGGAILVMESAESARARGARVYGEISGYGAMSDPRPGSGREPGLRLAIELALADAGAEPGDVDVVFADAAAIPELDRIEAEAITSVFGPRGVAVTAPKTMTGRLCTGAAPLDLAAALLAIEEGLIPPTVNVRLSDAYALDLIGPRPRTAEVRTALVLARGPGGFNSAVVVRAVD